MGDFPTNSWRRQNSKNVKEYNGKGHGITDKTKQIVDKYWDKYTYSPNG